ncbi:glycosyltransferase family 4 protein [Kluyvera sichuanensis]
MMIYLFLGDISAKGGVERVTISLANGLAKHYEVTIVSLYKNQEELSFFPVKDVNVLTLNKNEISMYNRRLGFLKGGLFDIKYINRKLKELNQLNINITKKDIFISCDIKMSILLYRLNRKYDARIIAIEHFEHDVGNFILKKIRTLLYPKLSAVVSLTDEDSIKYLSWLPKNKHKIIPNIVYKQESVISRISPITCSSKIVLAIGRLSYQKGFDLLLEAWARANTDGWFLRIIGDGEEKDNLINQASKLKIENYEIIPFQNEIEMQYAKAEIFILSSRFEGLGMVLVEALSHGLACISFDCPAGPKTIINNGNGILVPVGNIDELASSISYLMNNDNVRNEMKEKGILSIERFSEKAVIAEWRLMLNEL